MVVRLYTLAMGIVRVTTATLSSLFGPQCFYSGNGLTEITPSTLQLLMNLKHPLGKM